MRSMKKWMTVTAGIAAAALALAGCGSGTGASSGGKVKAAGDDEQVTLRINWWGADERNRRTEEAVAAFEKEHPNIKVEKTYSDWTGYWDKLATETAGKNAPDVIQMDEMYLASYGSSGALYDLDKVSEWLDTSKIDQSVMDMGKYDGTQYAAPLGVVPYAVLVNESVLNKLGLSLPEGATDPAQGWTWDQYREFGKQVVGKSNGEIVGSGLPGNGYGLTLWVRQHGEQLFKDGKLAVSEDTLTRYFEEGKSYLDDGILGSVDRWSEGVAATLNAGDLGTNKQAYGLNTATMLTPYAAATGTEDWTLAALPCDGSPKDSMYLKPSMYWSISATSKHPAEAAKLIDFLLNSEKAGDILGTERGIPANSDIRARLTESATGTDKTALEFTDKVSQNVGEAPEITPNGASDIDKIIQRHSQEVFFGTATPAEAAKAMIEELNSNIQNAS